VIVTPRLKERFMQYVREGDVIAVVEESAVLEAEITLAEQDVARVQPGEPVELKARALPFDICKARVDRIAPAAGRGDVQSTLTVYCRLEAGEAALRSGMTGHAHPVHFPQRLGDIFDAAQGKRADGAIEATVLEGQPFAAENLLVNLDPPLLDPLLRQPVHSGVRINRRELTDSLRVVGQVQPGPEADLHNVAVSTGEQFSPVPGQERLVQEQVAKAWDDYLREKAHGRLLPCLARAGTFMVILLACRPA
jgi:hypothetical protein